MDEIIKCRIENGEFFTKNELKSRLTQMDISCDYNEQRKSYFVKLYNTSVSNPLCQNKIRDRLIKDTKEYMERMANSKQRMPSIHEELVDVSEKRPKLETNLSQHAAIPDRIPSYNQIGILKTNKIPNLNFENEQTAKQNKEEKPFAKFTYPQKDVHVNPIRPSVSTTNISINNDSAQKEALNPTISFMELIQSNNPVKNQGEILNTKQSSFPPYNPSHTIPEQYKVNIAQQPVRPQHYIETINKQYMTPFKEEQIISGPSTANWPESNPNSQKHTSYLPAKSGVSKYQNEDTYPNIDVVKAQLEMIKRIQNQTANETLNKTAESYYQGSDPNGLHVSSNNLLSTTCPLFITTKTEVSSAIPVRIIIKYILAAAITTVLFYGLKSVIDNSGMNLFGKVFTWGTASTVHNLKQTNNTTIPKDDIDSTKLGATNNTEQLSAGWRFLGGAYTLFTNPAKFLKEYIIEIVIGWIMAKTYSIVKNKITYLVASSIFYYIYSSGKAFFRNRSISSQVFSDIKDRLRTLYDVSDFSKGITEDQIICDYAKQNGMSEASFKSNVFPRLKAMRKDDAQIKEFEMFENGRLKLGWQWAGY